MNESFIYPQKKENLHIYKIEKKYKPCTKTDQIRAKNYKPCIKTDQVRAKIKPELDQLKTASQWKGSIP